MTPDAILAELQRLDAQATPGAWEHGVVRDKTTDEHLDHLRESLEKGGQIGAYDLHGIYLQGDEKIIAISGNGPMSAAHADAIATLRNLLPQIIEALEEDKQTIKSFEAMKDGVAVKISDLEADRDALQQRVTRLDGALAGLAGEWAVLSARPSMTPSEDRHYSRALANHSAALLQLLVESRAALRLAEGEN